MSSHLLHISHSAIRQLRFCSVLIRWLPLARARGAVPLFSWRTTDRCNWPEKHLRVSAIKRELTTISKEDGLELGKRMKTVMSHTLIEGPSKTSSEGMTIEDVDEERYRSITLTHTTATDQEWKIVLSIFETPSLASRVKHVCLNSSSWYPDRRPDSFPPYEIKTDIDARAASMFKEIIAEQKWAPEDADRLLSALMHRNSDALAAILLPMCPQAEQFAVGEVKHLVPKIIELMDMPTPAYAITATHLHLVTCSPYHDAEYREYSFENFQTYTKLPRLTHLAMSGIGGIHVEDAGSYAQIPRYASPVQNIIIKKSQMGTECLLRIVKFARKDRLESFTYQTGGMISPDTSGAIIDFQMLWAALTYHSRTLKKLDLDIDSQINYNTGNYPGDSEDEEDSDLNDVELEHPPFRNLTCLRIGIDALMKLMIPMDSSIRLVDVLPPGLEELVIRGYDEKDAKDEAKSQLEEVKAKMGTGRLSNLVTLEGVDALISNGEDFQGDEDEWEDDGETNGDRIWT